ncbi:MAG: two-component sensor histidine kinase, partial [Hungatella sp.]
MWFDKKKELKTSYYRSFLALIVIPILMIILVSVGILRTMMQDAAIQNIRRAQDHVVATLTAEVKDVSLRLSHFVYVNDNEIMKTASKTNTKDIAARHAYTQVLTESFNYAMVPVQDILSAVFFMKDG